MVVFNLNSCECNELLNLEPSCNDKTFNLFDNL